MLSRLAALLLLLFAGAAHAANCPTVLGDCGTLNASNLNVLTINGATPPAYAAVGTWTAAQTFSAATTTFGASTNAGTTAAINVQNVAGALATLDFQRGGVRRWSWQLTNASPVEGVFNQGSNLTLFAYPDSGTDPQTAIRLQRTSGALGDGPPRIPLLAPYDQSTLKNTGPGGVFLNSATLTDTYPTTALPVNAASTTSGSPSVVITWTGCCGPQAGVIDAGPLLSGSGTGSNPGATPFVRIIGATPFNGVDLSAGGLQDQDGGFGWYQVISNPTANQARINYNVGGVLTNATATGSGGGNISVLPSSARQATRMDFTFTEASGPYPVADAHQMKMNPRFLIPKGTGPTPIGMQHFWRMVTPNDTSRLNGWTGLGVEWDLIHRGADGGYDPDMFGGTSNKLIGLWVDAWGDVDASTQYPGGGAANNVTQLFYCARYRPLFGATSKWVGAYGCLQNGPGTLVGKGFDTWTPDASGTNVGGHGGVFLDGFMAFDRLQSPTSVNPSYQPYTTHAGTGVVTINTQLNQGMLVGLTTNDLVYLPEVVTLDGVTFGGGTCPMVNIVPTAGTETADIQPNGSFPACPTGTGGTGTSGGGKNKWVGIDRHSPYAWGQMWGRMQHGLIVPADLVNGASQANFEDGMIIRSVPGGAYGFLNGTAVSKLDAQKGTTAADLNLVFTLAGTGTLKVGAASGVSCATGAVTAATVVVTNGIVTHC